MIRQRGETSEPFGNSSSAYVTMSTAPMSQIQLSIQPASTAPGSGTVRPTTPKIAYSSTSTWNADAVPEARSTQPTRFRGRRDTSTAPTPP